MILTGHLPYNVPYNLIAFSNYSATLKEETKYTFGTHPQKYKTAQHSTPQTEPVSWKQPTYVTEDRTVFGQRFVEHPVLDFC